jgi:hypothetical protein
MLPLSRDKAKIFRITHADNIPWLLEHGIVCRASAVYDPNYRNIGNPELIEKRTARIVPIPPGGTLNDYVPFYFTSRSPMLLNIKTGHNVPAVPMRDIVILATSLPRLASQGIPFVYTDRHAYLVTARFSSDLGDLDWIDWKNLRESNFSHDPDDGGKMERYQAEALIHRHLPVEALAGMICYETAQQLRLQHLVAQSGHAMKVVAWSDYYF